ncbi:hypothetical protein Nepgr_005456 [Nepenthes gracilis]|uniref:CYTH domain-containing protein n=1 Tax=Nepenthes gracilis TaxID=150966 RepID=A0AAD3S3N0_NEPGR|nr:hypothetical protein Nepgr_005456 [Nepenthes gracilis]
MEVEVKLKLPDSLSHQKLISILSPFHVQTLLQENIFFDTPTFLLAANRSALRLRLYDHDRRCVLSFKSSPAISDGISRAEEIEQEIEPTVGRACVAEPWRLSRIEPSNGVSERAREIIGGEDLFGKLVCLGGFRNVRNVYEWRGLKLEVDETLFDFGTSYEIECESENPNEAKRLIEELLESNGIGFCYSQVSKFAVFIAGKFSP